MTSNKGKVMPSATRGVVTNNKIGMPMATAPPNPAFDTAVVSAAQKASPKNKMGLVTSIEVSTDAKLIMGDHYLQKMQSTVPETIELGKW